MRKEKPKGKKKKAEKSYSGIDAHERKKKVLVPPLMAIPGIALQSWLNDRLPEMLWSSLLISALGRDRALERFREVAEFIPQLAADGRIVQPTLSSLAELEEGSLREFLSRVCADTQTKNALRPLLLFDDLPAREHWAGAIGQSPETKSWESLKAAGTSGSRSSISGSDRLPLAKGLVSDLVRATASSEQRACSRDSRIPEFRIAAESSTYDSINGGHDRSVLEGDFLMGAIVLEPMPEGHTLRTETHNGDGVVPSSCDLQTQSSTGTGGARETRKIVSKHD
jgi:hypothetical protein